MLLYKKRNPAILQYEKVSESEILLCNLTIEPRDPRDAEPPTRPKQLYRSYYLEIEGLGQTRLTRAKN